jgi:hypothetical protein
MARDQLERPPPHVREQEKAGRHEASDERRHAGG